MKYAGDGKMERFKARLVARGFTQQYGINYEDMFSPVIRFASIRILLAYAVQCRMLIHQMDVATAFLNGDLPEELYMCQPEGYVMKGQENLVCKLKKSIYGLKHSSRCWNAVFSEYMISLQFQQSTADLCIFVRNSDNISIVAFYIDNLIVIAKTQKEMERIKQALALKFKMKDLGKLHFCLGVHITYDEEKEILLMHQKQYITKILEKYYQKTEAKAVSTPASINVKLQKDDGSSKEVDAINYQSMVGSLLYVAVATRPDIAQAVGAVSKFSANPTVHRITGRAELGKSLEPQKKYSI